ncbi:MAG: PH domain-containing protein [Nanoarchaeota archaeon]
MAQQYELKPEKTAFVLYPLLGRLFTLSIIALIALVIAIFFPLVGVGVLGVVAVIFFIIYGLRSIRYGKEKYTFLSDRIICHTGSLVSDNETEVVLRNVTHVTVHVPWLQNKLFNTGTIKIEAAGSSESEIVLTSIKDPEKIYEYAMKLMQHGGFSLSKKHKIMEEKPHALAAALETSRYILGSIVAVLYIAFYIFAEAGESDAVFGILSLIGIPLVVLVILGLGVKFFLRYMDLRMRVYEVYSDVIMYSEGFLSKHYSFMPAENLTDAQTTQTIVDRVFGLYDVTVSCQGGGQEIRFKNIINGKRMEEVIDQVISGTSVVPEQKASTTQTASKTQATAEAQGQKRAAKNATFDQSFTAEYHINTKRVVVGWLFALLGFIWIPVMGVLLWFIILVVLLIKASRTTYKVTPYTIREEYSFLSSSNKEFSVKNITAVTFSESFVDRWYDTCSVTIWSIGASQPMTLMAIPKTSDLYDKLLAKAGIPHEEKLYRIDPQFSIGAALKKKMLSTIISVILLAVTALVGGIIGGLAWIPFIVVAVIVALIYVASLAYGAALYKRSFLQLYRNSAYAERGIWFKKYQWVRFDNIKGVDTIKYPLTDMGTLRLTVAGDMIAQPQQQQTRMGKYTQTSQARYRSNALSMEYVPRASTKDDLFDMILYDGIGAQEIVRREQDVKAYAEQPVISTRPALRNTVAVWVLILFVTFLTLFFFPLALVGMIFSLWAVRVRRYTITSRRIIYTSGIIYRKEHSILFSRIDHINVQQGMLNKIFGNGNISINTTGSSGTEMVLSNVPDHERFYRVLKQHY